MHTQLISSTAIAQAHARGTRIAQPFRTYTFRQMPEGVPLPSEQLIRTIWTRQNVHPNARSRLSGFRHYTPGVYQLLYRCIKKGDFEMINHYYIRVVWRGTTTAGCVSRVPESGTSRRLRPVAINTYRRH
jgi:hypothetical protein